MYEVLYISKTETKQIETSNDLVDMLELSYFTYRQRHDVYDIIELRDIETNEILIHLED